MRSNNPLSSHELVPFYANTILADPHATGVTRERFLEQTGAKVEDYAALADRMRTWLPEQPKAPTMLDFPSTARFGGVVVRDPMRVVTVVHDEPSPAIAEAFTRLCESIKHVADAFTKLGERMRPAIEQATRELADAGYHYDESAQAFVRGPDDNPIAVHRLLRYFTRAPQNRRRVREWRKNARRRRIAARKAAADYTIEHVVP